MNCEEFWEKLSDTWPGPGYRDAKLKTHLETCSQCREEFELLVDGLSRLKAEVLQEEPASFWHEMRREIAAGVKRPSRLQGLARFFCSWRTGAVFVTAILVAVFFIFGIQKLNDLEPGNDNLAFLLDPMPCVTLYEDLAEQAEAGGMDGLEPGVLAGLPDAWNILLDEVS